MTTFELMRVFVLGKTSPNRVVAFVINDRYKPKIGDTIQFKQVKDDNGIQDIIIGSLACYNTYYYTNNEDTINTIVYSISHNTVNCNETTKKCKITCNVERIEYLEC